MWKHAKDTRQPHPFHLVPTEVSKAILKAKIDILKVMEEPETKLKTNTDKPDLKDFTDISEPNMKLN